jgi:hypothetical protein
MYFIIQVAVGHNYIHIGIKKQNISVSDHSMYRVVLFCYIPVSCTLYNTLFERLESFLINWGKVQFRGSKLKAAKDVFVVHLS